MKILFVGDVMIGRLVNEILKIKNPEYVWGNTLPIFQQADLRICNLECVISDKGEPWSITPKVFHFRSDAKNIEVLKVANINIVSLANNHTLDYGYEAMFEMLNILKDNKIYYAGAGKNLEEASQPVILEVKNKKIGFIAFTDNEPAWSAEKNKPGIFYVELTEKGKNVDYLKNLIKETKKLVDYLIVSAHWGPNWGYKPLKEHIIFAHKFIEIGADLIFGHSPHIFRGIEVYKEKFILYSVGDFIDDYAVDEIERNDESFIFVYTQTTADETQTSTAIFELYPVIIKDFRVNLAEDEDRERIMSKMEILCQEFKTKTLREKDKLIVFK